jgi:hypothetical protein
MLSRLQSDATCSRVALLVEPVGMGLAAEQPGGPPSRDGVPLILPRKVRVSPRVEHLPLRGGYC